MQFLCHTQVSKCFQVLLPEINSIENYSQIYTWVREFKHYYILLIIQFNINHLFVLAQSTGAVEYTDCFSTEELDPLQWVSCIWH